MNFHRILFCAAAALSSSVAIKAVAQPVPPGDAKASTMLEEVTVTARRQSENLQDVPLAVTAYSPEALEQKQIVDRNSLADFTPSLMTITGGYPKEFAYFALRGQGPAFGAVPGVIPYFAEVANPVSIDGRPGSYVDLANIQVLAGPQGTLFGKNATGGNILFEPQRPTDRFEGSILAEGGNEDARRAAAVINVPIVDDKVLLRFAGEWGERDGATVDVGPRFKGRDYDNLNYHTERLSLTLRPTDSIENYTVARYYYSDNNGPGTVLTEINPITVAAFGAFYPGLGNVVLQQQDLGERRVSYDVDEFSETEYWQVVNQTTVELTDALTLKNIISYSEFQDWYGYDYDATPFALGGQYSKDFPTIRPNYFTEELQLNARVFDDAVNLTVGVYYDEQDYDGEAGIEEATQLPIVLLLGTITAFGDQGSESEAVFGQATWDVGRQFPSLAGLNLTGGLRKTWEESSQQLTIVLPPALGGPMVSGGSVDSDYDSYSVTADYAISDAAHIYITSRDAYKSGGINSGAPAAYDTFPPEKLQDVELGLKTQFPIGSAWVRANVAVYKGDYSDIQRTVPEVIGGITLNVNRSAAEAEIEGVEFTGEFVPIEGLSLTGTYSYIDSSYTKVTDTTVGALLEGSEFPYTPEHKYSIGINWELPLSDAFGTLRFSAAYTHQSDFSTAQSNLAHVQSLPEYDYLNLSAALENIGGKPVDVTVFVTNATDELYATGLQDQYNTLQGTVAYTYSEPRLYGLRLRYRFGE